MKLSINYKQFFKQNKNFMGNTQLKSRNTEQKLDFKILKEIPQRSIIILQDLKQNKILLRRQFMFTSQQFFNKQLKKIKSKKQMLVHSNIAPILEIQTKQQNLYCSFSKKITIYTEYFDWNLHLEINQRKQESYRRFSEKQLWKILSSCINALSYLEKQSIKHSSVRSQQIFLDRTLENIKLIDPYLTQSQTNFQINLEKTYEQNAYLSPQQLKNLTGQSSQMERKNLNNYKCDVFALGMVLLEAGLLENQINYINKINRKFQSQEIKKSLQRFNEIYSKSLTFFIEQMLNIEAKNRNQWIHLEKYIKRVISAEGNKNTLEINIRSKKYQQNVRNLQKQKFLSTKSQIIKVNQIPYSEYRKYLYNNQSLLNLETEQKTNYNNSSLIQPISIISNKKQLTNNPVFTFPQDKRQQPERSSSSPKKPIVLIKEQLSDLKKQTCKIIQEEPIEVTHQTINDQAQNEETSIFLIDNHINKPSSRIFKSSFNFIPHETNDYEDVVEIFKHGSRYQGQKLNGLRHGNGIFYYQDGGYYEGQWKKNRMAGYGKLYYQSGKLAYEGEWQNDQFQGFGILYNQNPKLLTTTFNFRNFEQVEEYWIKFEGQFHNDIKQGIGKLYLTNGERFQGHFKEDLVNGAGMYYQLNQKICRGIWNQNIYQEN